MGVETPEGGVARIAQSRGITDIELPMLITAMMLMMQIAAKVDSDCDARREKGCGEPVEACPWWAGGGWDR